MDILRTNSKCVFHNSIKQIDAMHFVYNKMFLRTTPTPTEKLDNELIAEYVAACINRIVSLYVGRAEMCGLDIDGCVQNSGLSFNECVIRYCSALMIIEEDSDIVEVCDDISTILNNAIHNLVLDNSIESTRNA